MALGGSILRILAFDQNSTDNLFFRQKLDIFRKINWFATNVLHKRGPISACIVRTQAFFLGAPSPFPFSRKFRKAEFSRKISEFFGKIIWVLGKIIWVFWILSFSKKISEFMFHFLVVLGFYRLKSHNLFFKQKSGIFPFSEMPWKVWFHIELLVNFRKAEFFEKLSEFW